MLFAAIILFSRSTPDSDINAEFHIARATFQGGHFREAIDRFNELLPKTSDPMPLNLIGKKFQAPI